MLTRALQFATISIILSCSHPEELSSGDFDLQSANSFEFNGLKIEVVFDREVTPSGKPITGQLFLSKEQMFRDVAKELQLNYSKTYYYYPRANFNNRVRIGKDIDTLNFEVYSNGPMKKDTTTFEGFGIKATFSNLTHSYDTTFIMTKNVDWD